MKMTREEMQAAMDKRVSKMSYATMPYTEDYVVPNNADSILICMLVRLYDSGDSYMAVSMSFYDDKTLETSIVFLGAGLFNKDAQINPTTVKEHVCPCPSDCLSDLPMSETPITDTCDDNATQNKSDDSVSSYDCDKMRNQLEGNNAACPKYGHLMSARTCGICASKQYECRKPEFINIELGNNPVQGQASNEPCVFSRQKSSLSLRTG